MLPRKLLTILSFILILYVLFIQKREVPGTPNSQISKGQVSVESNAEPALCGIKIPKDTNGLPLKIYDDLLGTGKPISCGTVAMMSYKIWDIEGNLISHADAVKTIAGEDKFPYALELAIAGDGVKPGMSPGAKRTIIAPPAFTKTPGIPPALILPENEVLLIEVEVKTPIPSASVESLPTAGQ